MKLDFGKAFKMLAGLALAIPAVLGDSFSMRGAKADVSVKTRSGTILYRPDGDDSTLLCLTSFASIKEPTAYRIYDMAGSDAYPENFSELLGVGNSAKLEECNTAADRTISRDGLIGCIDAIATKKISGRKDNSEMLKLIAERVSYLEECVGPAKPKSATIASKNRRSGKVNVTVEAAPENNAGSFRASR